MGFYQYKYIFILNVNHLYLPLILGFAAAAGLSEYYYPANFEEYYYEETPAQQRGSFRRESDPKPKARAAAKPHLQHSSIED